MENNNNNLDPSLIIMTVARCQNVSPEIVTAPGRRYDIIKIKHIAMFCCRQFTSMSLSHIGRIFNKDHATILHAIKSVKNQADVYPAYRNELNEILNELKIKAINKYDEYRKYERYETENI